MADPASPAWFLTMVTIDDASENSWIEGICDICTEGTYVWSDGSSSTYRSWHSGEPNDSGNDDCITTHRWSDDTWNDQSCSSTLRFICEP